MWLRGLLLSHGGSSASIAFPRSGCASIDIDRYTGINNLLLTSEQWVRAGALKQQNELGTSTGGVISGTTERKCVVVMVGRRAGHCGILDWNLVGFRNAWTVPLVPHYPGSVQSWRTQVGKKWLPAAGVYYKTSLTLAQLPVWLLTLHIFFSFRQNSPFQEGFLHRKSGQALEGAVQSLVESWRCPENDWMGHSVLWAG